MPIPHIHENTEYIQAGNLTFGVEFRRVDDEILQKAAVNFVKADTTGVIPAFGGRRASEPPGPEADCGVSIHVFDNEGSGLTEHLRFDCFDIEPHYHYV